MQFNIIRTVLLCCYNLDLVPSTNLPRPLQLLLFGAAVCQCQVVFLPLLNQDSCPQSLHFFSALAGTNESAVSDGLLTLFSQLCWAVFSSAEGVEALTLTLM